MITLAAQLKAKLLSRGQQMEEMQMRQARSDAGTIRKLHPEVYDTITKDLQNLGHRQMSQGLVYATLRWVLGVTEDVDPQNLQLND